MPISSTRTRQITQAARDKKMSRAAKEQQALEGRGRDIYRYLKKRELTAFVDENLLYLSWLWLYADPKRELTVDQFMDLTEPEVHDRFDKLKSKNHLQVLTDFKKVVDLYAMEDGAVEVPHRYAL